MQSIDGIFDMILVFTLITFFGTVAWGLIRYSKKQSFRLWAIGLIIYMIGALQGGFLSETILAPQDLIAITGMFIGSTLILDGTRSSGDTKIRYRIYGIGSVLLAGLLIIGIVFHIQFQYVFIPLGFYIAAVCILTSRTVSSLENVGDSSKWWLFSGLITIAVSWLIFPLTILFPEIYLWFLLIQAVGVIVTASSMLTLFTRIVTNNLETQYNVSQILSGLIQHDIRNYIQTAHHALELTEISDVVENHWINIATEVLADAGHFVDEMRDISVSLNQESGTHEKIPLSSVVYKAKDRVIMEYNLTTEQIQIQLPADMMVEKSRLIDELLWNIFDNAFKHGSPSLSIQGTVSDKNGGIELEISDRGNGLPENIKTFLNSPNALSKPDQPLVGLGVILIRGIASLRGIHLVVSDNDENIDATGTKYSLKFR
ncbi:MAG: HAMP domain-containing histidine kinase [Candidatus Thorarchaeota archaeon]|nr:HAMP domain-containing histidine kinase [Candidatus Thorarchaeota archaeon]